MALSVTPSFLILVVILAIGIALDRCLSIDVWSILIVYGGLAPLIGGAALQREFRELSYGGHMVNRLRLVRFVHEYRRARLLGFQFLSAIFAARVNSTCRHV